MDSLLEQVVVYLANKVTLEPGVSAFYNECPGSAAVSCLLVQEELNSSQVPAQIDAEIHRLRFTLRAKTNDAAAVLANKCYR